MAKSFRLNTFNRYNSQKGVRYVNKRLLDLLKKSSFFKKKIVLYFTKVLFFARQRLGVNGLLSAPDYSYGKSRNQYVYHGYEDVEKHILHNPPSTWHSLCKKVLRQKELPICTVQPYCNTRTAMVAAVVAAQCKPQQSPVPL